jgi:hypothetical protein
MSFNLLEKMSHFGASPRSAVRNQRSDLRYLLKNGLARKAVRKGRVFYELTEKALPLLEDYREMLLHKAALLNRLTPHAKLYRALLEDLRFLDEKNPRAEEFRLLGDWHLLRPVVPSQLKLAQMRYYREQGLA